MTEKEVFDQIAQNMADRLPGDMYVTYTTYKELLELEDET